LVDALRCVDAGICAADVRVELVQRLRRNDWSDAMGRALSARFAEVIVDEGQGCNPLDCDILNWLRNAGVLVTVVADPDQAIYGFRHDTPADLRLVSDAYAPADRLSLTGNFRSGPAICAVAAPCGGALTPMCRWRMRRILESLCALWLCAIG
jgi:DNA helicase II / ATP-dependent DNA helicase PcrA